MYPVREASKSTNAICFVKQITFVMVRVALTNVNGPAGLKRNV